MRSRNTKKRYDYYGRQRHRSVLHRLATRSQNAYSPLDMPLVRLQDCGNDGFVQMMWVRIEWHVTNRGEDRYPPTFCKSKIEIIMEENY